MSVVVRLTKTGKKGEAKYRVIVKEKRSRRDGKAVEELGWVIKVGKDNTLSNLKRDRINYWISQGAIVTSAVKKILS